MDLNSYPPGVREYVSELIKRKAVNTDSILLDKTFINHLYTQRFDEDYIKSVFNDRRLDK